MSSEREKYTPGPPSAQITSKDGENWTFVLVKELRHSPDAVWAALTDPAQLREWAPFDADTSLAATGAPVKLTTIGAPAPHNVAETTIAQAEPGKLLVFAWGGNHLRWELEPIASGTRLTLWASINHRYISMGAAGWQICLDVLDRLLAGSPIGRIAGPETMQFSGWQQLNAAYAARFGVAS